MPQLRLPPKLRAVRSLLGRIRRRIRAAFLGRVVYPLRRLADRSRARLWRLERRRLLATWRTLTGVVESISRRRQEPGLTVAVDIDALFGPLTGIGWYLHCLLTFLADQEGLRLRLYGPSVVGHSGAPEPFVDPPSGRAIEVVSHPIDELSSVPSHWLYHALYLLQPLLLAADRNRLVFAPNFVLPRRFGLCRGALVATVHDLGLWKVPSMLQAETRETLERRLEALLRRADGLLTPSFAVRQELIDHGVEPGRITAIHHGPGHLPGAEIGELPEGTPERFVLFVGTIEPRKNLAVVLDALEGWEGIERPSLVLCGRLGWHGETMVGRLELATAAGWLRHFGYVDLPQLAALYQAASVVVLPSVYEGFGLPVVEALWAGKAMVVSDIPVLREVAGDAALFVPPDDPLAWRAALRRLFTEPELSRSLSVAARQRIAAFDWRKSAAQTLLAWQRAVGDEEEAGMIGSAQ